MTIFSSSSRRSDTPFNIHRHQGYRQGMYRYAAKTFTCIINIGKKMVLSQAAVHAFNSGPQEA